MIIDEILTYESLSHHYEDLQTAYEAFHVSSPGAAREREIMLFSACV